MSFLLKAIIFVVIVAVLAVFIYAGFLSDSVIQQTVVKTIR